MARRTFLQVAAAGALAACAPNASSSSDGGASSPSSNRSAGVSRGDAAPSSPTDVVPSDASGATNAPATAPPTPTSLAPPASSAQSAGGSAAFVRSGPSTRNQVALTFHCNGTPALATKLLDLLRERSVPVTVFAVGNWLTDNPALARRILDEGHELANHTWSHQPMGSMSKATMDDEISRCASAIQKFTGSIGPWFRPSGIEVPPTAILAEAGKAGYRTSVGYDVDSLDFQDPGAAAVRANVAKGVKAGSIVSMHFGHANTPSAMPSILDDLAVKGLAPVTVTTLLS